MRGQMEGLYSEVSIDVCERMNIIQASSDRIPNILDLILNKFIVGLTWVTGTSKVLNTTRIKNKFPPFVIINILTQRQTNNTFIVRI